MAPKRKDSLPADQSNLAPFQANPQERRTLTETWRTPSYDRYQNKRSEPRFDIHDKIAEGRFTHPGGGEVNAEVLVMDLSARGLCIMHGGYLHPSTSCTITLRNHRGEARVCLGTVAWCRFVRGRFHAAGIIISEPIDPREFVDPTVWLEHAHEMADKEANRIVGRALMLNNDPLQAVVLQMILSDTEMRLEHVESSGALTDAICTGGCDLIVLDSDAPDEPADSLIRRIRKDGYRGVAIALSSDSQPNTTNRLRDAGFDEVLQKPLLKDDLITSLHMLSRQSVDAADGTGPIYSSLTSGAIRPDWLSRYVKSAVEKADELEDCAKADDLEATNALCESFRSTGTSFGYGLVTNAAEDALKALRASCSPRESMSAIYRLIRVIKRLSPESAPTNRVA